MTGHKSRKASSRTKPDARLRNRIRKLEGNVNLLAKSIVGMSRVIQDLLPKELTETKDDSSRPD